MLEDDKSQLPLRCSFLFGRKSPYMLEGNLPLRLRRGGSYTRSQVNCNIFGVLLDLGHAFLFHQSVASND